ncbi:hypothetical protein HDU98_002164 [Podochytrium sp. JEL0797]|nr:hypothetical protein HDU98_002164 [Podochytrium sp. JEL0797]
MVVGDEEDVKEGMVSEVSSESLSPTTPVPVEAAAGQGQRGTGDDSFNLDDTVTGYGGLGQHAAGDGRGDEDGAGSDSEESALSELVFFKTDRALQEAIWARRGASGGGAGVKVEEMAEDEEWQMRAQREEEGEGSEGLGVYPLENEVQQQMGKVEESEGHEEARASGSAVEDVAVANHNPAPAATHSRDPTPPPPAKRRLTHMVETHLEIPDWMKAFERGKVIGLLRDRLRTCLAEANVQLKLIGFVTLRVVVNGAELRCEERQREVRGIVRTEFEGVVESLRILSSSRNRPSPTEAIPLRLSGRDSSTNSSCSSVAPSISGDLETSSIPVKSTSSVRHQLDIPLPTHLTRPQMESFKNRVNDKLVSKFEKYKTIRWTLELVRPDAMAQVPFPAASATLLAVPEVMHLVAKIDSRRDNIRDKVQECVNTVKRLKEFQAPQAVSRLVAEPASRSVSVSATSSKTLLPQPGDVASPVSASLTPPVVFSPRLRNPLVKQPSLVVPVSRKSEQRSRRGSGATDEAEDMIISNSLSPPSTRPDDDPSIVEPMEEPLSLDILPSQDARLIPIASSTATTAKISHAFEPASLHVSGSVTTQSFAPLSATSFYNSPARNKAEKSPPTNSVPHERHTLPAKPLIDQTRTKSSVDHTQSSTSTGSNVSKSLLDSGLSTPASPALSLGNAGLPASTASNPGVVSPQPPADKGVDQSVGLSGPPAHPHPAKRNSLIDRNVPMGARRPVSPPLARVVGEVDEFGRSVSLRKGDLEDGKIGEGRGRSRLLLPGGGRPFDAAMKVHGGAGVARQTLGKSKAPSSPVLSEEASKGVASLVLPTAVAADVDAMATLLPPVLSKDVLESVESLTPGVAAVVDNAPRIQVPVNDPLQALAGQKPDSSSRARATLLSCEKPRGALGSEKPDQVAAASVRKSCLGGETKRLKAKAKIRLPPINKPLVPSPVADSDSAKQSPDPTDNTPISMLPKKFTAKIRLNVAASQMDPASVETGMPLETPKVAPDLIPTRSSLILPSTGPESPTAAASVDVNAGPSGPSGATAKAPSNVTAKAPSNLTAKAPSGETEKSPAVREPIISSRPVASAKPSASSSNADLAATEPKRKRKRSTTHPNLSSNPATPAPASASSSASSSNPAKLPSRQKRGPNSPSSSRHAKRVSAPRVVESDDEVQFISQTVRKRVPNDDGPIVISDDDGPVVISSDDEVICLD